jgi:hypothetical protein
MGRHEEAATQLEAYLRVAPAASDAGKVKRMLHDLREGRAPEDGQDL